MIMSILAIGIMAGIAYSWGSRGGFSSMLNCFCVLLAGAIGYGLWEHVAGWLIQSAGPRGFSSFFADIAWGAGLAIPFALSLAVLRGIVDGAVRKNLKFSPAGDWIVGCTFGAVSGLVISGVSVQTISGLRVGNEALGYAAISSDNSGNVQRGAGLILPTDRITNWLYSGLSRGTFASSTPMAVWNPDPAAQLASTRFSFGEGKGRNSIKNADFEVIGRYVLDPAKMTPAPPPPKPANLPQGAPTPPAVDLNDLRADMLDPGPQSVKMFDGEAPTKEAKLHGVLVKFRAGAKERGSGQFIISNGQIYIIAEDDSGRHEIFFPSAAICKAEAGKVAIARFRFDSKDTHLASLGGDSESNWAFEFFIPPQFEPKAVVVKGTRVRLDEDEKFQPVAFENRVRRDALITAGQLTSGKAGGQIDETRAIRLTASGNEPIPGVNITNALGVTLQDGTLGSGMTVVNNRISNGELTIDPKDTQGRGLDQSLRVDKFAHPEQVGLLRLDVGAAQGENSLLGGVVRDAESDPKVPATPFVIDSNGVKYDAIGYIYQDSSKFNIKYSIGEPVRSTNDIPRLSRSRPDQRMQLIFAPTVGVEIVGWGVGNKLVAKYVPGLTINTQR
ncbi:MAG: hypothetical protein K2Y21_15310 [Phycisphaerales bacterium]|nr:hypothetical protein [Phycisphaerales bacterium]